MKTMQWLGKLTFLNRVLTKKIGLGLFIFVLIGFAAFFLFKKELAPTLPQKVSVYLSHQLVVAGVRPLIPIQGEVLHADTMVLRFYVDRSFKPAWVNDQGVSPLADTLIALLKTSEEEGLKPEDYHFYKLDSLLNSVVKQYQISQEWNLTSLADLDLILTDAYLLYGSHLLSGRVDPETVDPLWLTQYPEIDMTLVLKEALIKKNLKKSLQELLPGTRDYYRLRDELARYKAIAWRGGWPIVPEGPSLRRGQSGYRVAALRARLMASGQYTPTNLNQHPVFDDKLENALKQFQCLHGLEQTGIVDQETRKALNLPALFYVRKLAQNMERWRWLNRDLGNHHILVNIAAFQLQIIKDEQVVFEMPVVVGKNYRQTPVFSGTMTHLVLNPYWNIPNTILVEDIIPKVKQDPDYLKNKDIEVLANWDTETIIATDTIRWSRLEKGCIPYRFRQKPGDHNSLGRIKFIFPNKYDVYLHDTPYRSHFKEKERAYSSGCIRLERPLDLATYLLKDQEKWVKEALVDALNSMENQTILLTEPIPVHLLYLTAWAHPDGAIHYYEDIYHRDELLENALRQQNVLQD